MSLKNLVRITILGVIGFVLEMAGGYLSFIFGPLALYINHSLASLLVAPVFFVLCHQVPRRGTLFLYYLLMGLIYSVMGFWPMLVICLITALLAELLVAKPENYTDDRRLSLAYVVAQSFLAMHGLMFFLLLKMQGVQKIFPDMFTEEMAKEVGEFYGSFGNVLIVLVIQVVVAYLGAIFGRYIYRKFFDKHSDETSVLD